MVRRVGALADNTKGVVFHDRGAADAAQQALAHAAVEADDGDLGGGYLDVHGDLAQGHPRDEDEDGHEDGEVELLRAEERVGVAAPLSAREVVAVTEDDEHPGHGEAEPPDEAVVALECVVVAVADPGEGAEDGDDDADVGHDSHDDYGARLY